MPCIPLANRTIINCTLNDLQIIDGRSRQRRINNLRGYHECNSIGGKTNSRRRGFRRAANMDAEDPEDRSLLAHMDDDHRRCHMDSGILCLHSQHPFQQAHREQQHVCAECGKSYATSSNLSRHKQTHRPLDSPHAKKCTFCDRIYVSMPALRYFTTL